MGEPRGRRCISPGTWHFPSESISFGSEAAIRPSARRLNQTAESTIRLVAYDETLVERLRELLGGERRLTERKMFGGLAFLINGNMAIAASRQGGVLVRADPMEADRIIATSNAEMAVMRGRPMDGWLRVAPEHLRTKRQLAKWAALGAASARSLPPKK